jgi:hypothetical protein
MLSQQVFRLMGHCRRLHVSRLGMEQVGAPAISIPNTMRLGALPAQVFLNSHEQFFACV